MKSTIKDIQKHTNLSLSTISKYLNGGNVLPENKIKIDIAINKLDFRVNQFARSLKTNKSNTIGVLIPELNSTFNTSIIAGVEEVLRANGLGVIICDSRLSKEEEKQAIEFLISKKVDGIITIPFDKKGEHLGILRNENIPFILIDRLVSEYNADSVIIDNKGASKTAINELIKSGHKKIGIIVASDKIYTMKERLLGYNEALRENNIDICEDFVIIEDMTITGGYDGFKKIMKNDNKPTAVFFANYELTLGAVIAINEMGLKIGKDISVIGFDNLELAKVITPKLTMIVQPIEEIAKSAAKLMLKKLYDNTKSNVSNIIILEAMLDHGNSVLRI